MSHFQLLQQLKQCTKNQLVIHGMNIHAHVMKSGFDLHRPLNHNALIDMYSKCGHLKDAVQLFDEMPQRDLASWASIFTAHNQAKFPERTLYLFSTMLSVDGFLPDHYIYATLVKGCASLRALRVGLQVHAQFLVSPFSDDDIVKSSLVDLYAKCRVPDYAHKVFNSILEKSVVSWTSLIYGYARLGRKSEVDKILWEMPYKNLQSWTAVISGFVQSGRGIESFRYFNGLRREGVFIEEPFVLSSLVVGSANFNMLELGKQVHRLVLVLGFGFNSYISNTLIDMYAKCSDVFSAEKVFNDMITPDVVSWTSIIVGMAQHGRGNKSLALYDEMILSGFEPNEVTFTGLIYACSHVGLIEKGQELFESMVRDYRLKPSLQHYTCLVDLYSRSGEIQKAEDILNTMPFKPDEAAWGVLLSSCLQTGEIETGVRIANHLLELEPEDSSTCILMSNIFARACMWKSVSKVRKFISGMEVKKKPGFSCVDLGKENEVFYAGETTHFMKDEISGLLKELDFEMRKMGYLPDTSFVLHDMDELEKERQLFWHSERVAVVYGLLKSAPGATIRIHKNLRVCGDCHTVFKYICSIVKREIIVRDANRYHHFSDGVCSCGDFW